MARKDAPEGAWKIPQLYPPKGFPLDAGGLLVCRAKAAKA
jgi:hypothetical protein